MRHGTGTTTLALAAAFVAPVVFAQDTGPEWVSLSAAQARIVFVAPGLEDQRARYLRGEAEDHSYTVEIAVWSGSAARHDKAVVAHTRLSPGYHYRARSDPKVFLESDESFEGKGLVFERLRRNGNRLGVIESRRFRFDDVACLGFASYWGESGTDGASAGTELLYGYYCADPGQPLSEETRKAVIAGLGVRDKLAP